MLPKRFLSVPVFLSLAVSCVMGITLLGGCPRQQVPTQPTEEEEDVTETPLDTDQGEQDRPIPGPLIDEDGSEDGGAADDEGETDEEEEEEDEGTGAFSVRFNEPLHALAVRPGAEIDLGFKLTDRDGVITKTEFVLARDNDEDGKPDGKPVKTKRVTLTPGFNKITYDTNEATALLASGYGRFLLGLRVKTNAGKEETSYASGVVTIDGVPPTATWVSPTGDKLVSPGSWNVKLQTSDNSPHTVQVLLDNDTNPDNGFGGILVGTTEFGAGTAVRSFSKPLSISAGSYYYLVIVSDGIDPPTRFYAPNLELGGGKLAQLMVTNRLVGEFDLNRLDPDTPLYDNNVGSSKGVILQGFNFNDLAGSSMTGVPDLDGDGFDELVVVSRFGKPRVIGTEGVGWGEGYLVLGSGNRLRTPKRLNAVGVLGGGGIDGLVFTGIRAPKATSWSEGMSDVTYVPDMDGDELPDLVFSFPRVESISLGNGIWQYPELGAYHTGMGSLEYDPADDDADTEPTLRAQLQVPLGGGTWLKNRTQFTRGGIVMVSSSNAMFKDRNRLNAKGDRIIDLHETGQCFNNMDRPEVFPLIESASSEIKEEDCGEPELTPYEEVSVSWDMVYRWQAPVGFENWQTSTAFQDPLNPPLANMWNNTWSLPAIGAAYLTPIDSKCEAPNCVVINQWLPFTPCNGVDTGTSSLYFPPGWPSDLAPGFLIHTGFYGRGDPEGVHPWDTTVGARVLGQSVNDKFGTAVSADDTWLYISAAQHTAEQADVPDLPTQTRNQSGVVYQYRIYSPSYVGNPTRSQLWIEPGERWTLDPELQDPDPEDPLNYIKVPLSWPYPDVHRLAIEDVEQPEEGEGEIIYTGYGGDHADFPMPVPHTYIIEDKGSHRGQDYFWPDEWLRIFPTGNPAYEEGVRHIEYPLASLLPVGSCAIEQLLQLAVEGGVRAVAPCVSDVWPSGGVGSSNWYISRTPQIVGPHDGATISFVRSVGDVDDDGVGDFAVGSENVCSDILNGTGPVTGAIFIVFGRPTGLEGDYLLEKLALPTNDIDRLAGVVLKGNVNEKLARVFDGAGNVNGDIFNDVIIGSKFGSASRGEAIVLLGSRYLQSPGGGWTVNQAVAAGVAVRFTGESIGDFAGANVAGAGDVDGDGKGDILIAAPGAEGGKGAVYLIYGSTQFKGGQSISLSLIGTFDLPGVKFIGRNAGDALGGGKLVYGDSDPLNPNGFVFLNPDQLPVTVYSDGVASIGDLDNDGKGDFAISAMLADPLTRRDAGEVYVIYGRGD